MIEVFLHPVVPWFQLRPRHLVPKRKRREQEQILDECQADIPIIMMSAMPESAVRERYDGYFAFLRKPFRIQHAAEIVARALDRETD